MTFAALVLFCLALLNVLTMIVWGIDKDAAERGDRRVPEATLLMLATLGGSPAALIASRVFRHKTVKQPFRSILLAIAWLQGIGLALVLIWMTGWLAAPF